MNHLQDGKDHLHPPFLHRFGPTLFQQLDYGLAIVLLLATLPHILGRPEFRQFGASLALALGAAIPIALRRHAPLAAVIIATVALTIATAVGDSFAPDPLIAFPIYLFASVRERHETIPVLLGTSVALIVAAIIGSATHPSEGQASFSVLVSIAAWFVGDSVRVRRAYVAGIAEQAAQRSREAVERAQRGVAEERLRIARELHDVVAHSLSVIAVQSGVGKHVIDEQPEQAKRALGIVEEASRSTLSELRRMLGILRRGDTLGVEHAPAPGLFDLNALLDQIRSAGVEVDAELGDLSVLHYSPALELTIYRIVQEALTNVVKHVGPTTAHVRLVEQNGEVVVVVTDDGTTKFKSHDDDDGEHHGIVGIRERVALFDGTFSAGPCPTGGFKVEARMPISGNLV